METPYEDILAVLLGEASNDQHREFERWLRESPENDATFRMLEEVWAAAEPPGNPNVVAEPPMVDEIVRRAERLPVVDLLATRRGGLEAELSRTKIFAWTVGRGWIAAGLAGVAAGIVLGVLGALQFGEPESPFARQEFRTSAGEYATVTLGDGTVIRLAPSTSVSFNGGSGNRDVHLDGQAFFAVARNPSSPFTVHTAAGKASVVGTRFDARARGGRLDLAVVEGEVMVSAGAGGTSVRANEIVRVATGQDPTVQRVDDIFAEISWLGGFLAVESTSLENVVSELTRRFGLRVQIEDHALRTRTVTGRFADQTPAEILAAICRAVDATCSTRAGLVVMKAVSRL